MANAILNFHFDSLTTSLTDGLGEALCWVCGGVCSVVCGGVCGGVCDGGCGAVYLISGVVFVLSLGQLGNRVSTCFWLSFGLPCPQCVF